MLYEKTKINKAKIRKNKRVFSLMNSNFATARASETFHFLSEQFIHETLCVLLYSALLHLLLLLPVIIIIMTSAQKVPESGKTQKWLITTFQTFQALKTTSRSSGLRTRPWRSWPRSAGTTSRLTPSAASSPTKTGLTTWPRPWTTCTRMASSTASRSIGSGLSKREERRTASSSSDTRGWVLKIPALKIIFGETIGLYFVNFRFF